MKNDFLTAELQVSLGGVMNLVTNHNSNNRCRQKSQWMLKLAR